MGKRKLTDTLFLQDRHVEALEKGEPVVIQTHQGEYLLEVDG